MSIIIRSENNKHWVYTIDYVTGCDVVGDSNINVYCNETIVGEITNLRGLEVNKKYNLNVSDHFVKRNGYISLKSDLVDLDQTIFRPWDNYIGKVPKIG